MICLLHIICKGQITFNNNYKTGYNNFFSTNIFTQTDSSNIIFNYVEDSASGRQDLGILKINKQGIILQNKSTNLNVDYLAYTTGLKNFIQISNSSFIATSVTYTNTNNNATLIFTKIDKTTLDTTKTKFYDDNIFSYAVQTIIRIHSNKYFCIGNKWNTTTQWPVIFHLDSNLNIVNTITLNNPINLTCNNAVLHPITKKLLFSGTITYNSNKYNIGFIAADTLGVISNTAIINYNGIQGIAQLKYCSFDNSYIFSGSLRTSKYGSNSMTRLQLTKLDATTLNVTWSKTYGSASIINNLKGLVINDINGSVTSCGIYSDSTSLPLMNYDTKGILLKVNALGDSLWMRQYNNYQTPPNPLNYFEILYSIEKTYDGGYITCGGVMNQPQAKAWVLKTDSLGCLSPGCGSVINGTPTVISGIKTQQTNEVGQNIIIYPNPANNILNVEMLNLASTGSATKLEIINSLGQVLSIIELSNQTSTININELPSGLYQLKLNEGSEQRVFKFIKN
jgi:hypothetical protein